jgi:hypothetical protein
MRGDTEVDLRDDFNGFADLEYDFRVETLTIIPIIPPQNRQ